jgi:FtsP/CotA-like multicopper oxidase with cupredoxin domain
MIVHDPFDPYLAQYDEERVILVSDWLNETAESHFHNWKEFENAFYYHRSANYNPDWDSYKGGWYWQTNNGTNFWSNEFGT